MNFLAFSPRQTNGFYSCNTIFIIVSIFLQLFPFIFALKQKSFKMYDLSKNISDLILNSIYPLILKTSRMSERR